MFFSGKEIFNFNVYNKNVNFPSQFFLGSISNGLSNTESREICLNSFGYNSIGKSDILNIRKYLMTNNNLK